jgi:hypothetical protein
MSFRSLCTLVCVSTFVSVQQPDNTSVLMWQAKDGNPSALYSLALMSETGDGQKKDVVRAAQLYEQAASAGHVPAKARLAYLYQTGAGVRRDPALAFRLYEQAAESDVEAQFQTALCHLRGLGTAADLAAGRQWLTRAAHADHQEAQLMLGLMLQQGLGGPKNEYSARRWFQRAATGFDYAIAERASRLQQQIDDRILASSSAPVRDLIALALGVMLLDAVLGSAQPAGPRSAEELEHDRHMRRLQCEMSCRAQAHAATTTFLGMMQADVGCRARSGC